jgi:hypothetical protein
MSTKLSKINLIPNQTNAKLVSEFQHYMQSRNLIGIKNNNLQVINAFANILGSRVSFYNIENIKSRF